MKIFVEAFKKTKISEEEETLEMVLQQEFNTIEEAIEYGNSIKDQYDYVRIHLCKHDEQQPCEIRDI